MSELDICIEDLLGKILYIIVEHKGIDDILRDKNLSDEEKKIVNELLRNYKILNTITNELPKKSVVIEDYDDLIKKYDWKYDYKDYDYSINVRKDRSTDKSSNDYEQYYKIIKKYIEQNKIDIIVCL